MEPSTFDLHLSVSVGALAPYARIISIIVYTCSY